jgi:hypothetical protein
MEGQHGVNVGKKSFDILEKLIDWKKISGENKFFYKSEHRQKNVDGIIIPFGIKKDHIEISITDFDPLIEDGLIKYTSDTTFYITKSGEKIFYKIKTEEGQLFNTIEKEVNNYLNNEQFKIRRGSAYTKWADASAMIQGPGTESQLTQIGHLCREAMQEYAESIAREFNLLVDMPDKNKDKKRIRGVLEKVQDRLGKTEWQLLNALIDYWEAVSGLAQRQEHGKRKPGETLTTEDARRLVFHCAIVMFEVERAIQRANA